MNKRKGYNRAYFPITVGATLQEGAKHFSNGTGGKNSNLFKIL